jgi:hypothetical protein
MPEPSKPDLCPYDRWLLAQRRIRGPHNPRSKPGDPRLRPEVCALLAPGHRPHWIQALGSENKPEIAALTVTGRVVSLDGELIILDLPDGTAGFRNHNPDLMHRCLSDGGRQVRFNRHYRVLRWPAVPGPVFEVAPNEGFPLGRCLTDGDLADPDRSLIE